MDSDTCVLMFLAAVFTIANGRNKVCINRWIDKMWCIYIHNGILFSLKKKWTVDTYYNMEEQCKHDKWNKPNTKGQMIH